MQKNKILSFLILVCMIPLFLNGCRTFSKENKELMKISILKTGRVDTIILQKNSHAMMIDCAEEDDGQEILSFLEKEGIEKIDQLIITHFDSDHVGAADLLVEAIPVRQVLLPAYENTNKDYLEFKAAMEKVQITPLLVKEKYAFDFEDCKVLVEPPDTYDYDEVLDNDNDLSLITSITFDKHRFLFAGDIEKTRIISWLETKPGKYDFMKFPHHGDYHSGLKDLLEECKPEYIAICDSKKNPASQKTIELARSYGTVLETRNGDITLLSDGRRIEFRQ